MFIRNIQYIYSDLLSMSCTLMLLLYLVEAANRLAGVTVTLCTDV